MVGSVVTDAQGQIVGEGWHRGPGTEHAEMIALRSAGDSARGGTAYVTLEPCSHHGRTPPCADALIDAGISTVVIGAEDPDPKVAGKGIEKLRAAGIEVFTDIEKDAARSVDPAYFHHRETGMPLVTVKWAMTLDGSVAAADGTSRWITGPEARRHAHTLRSLVDGVVVGAGTLRDDDPQLDVRLDGYEGPQPRPVIVAGASPLPDNARIWERDPVVVSAATPDIPAGVLLEVPGKGGLPDPVETCRLLGEMGLIHLLVEGGPSLIGSWWAADVISDGVVYLGAKVGGGVGKAPVGGDFPTIDEAVGVEFGGPQSVGTDVVITFTRKT